ncbi:hypothetical protein AB205_0057970 [Aquarana catesbeiana]|uniref:Uncharacterized protein n=1 Tax=Aquarana catesbeiana TaxID=8400 RepID=A0A2G9RCA8_AQUCT|nr:hypothetical protein AB205_0057970 [Aquarana catesbeiana]
MPAWMRSGPEKKMKKRREEDEDEEEKMKRRAGASPHAMGAERPEEKEIEDTAEEMLDENAGGRTRRARRTKKHLNKGIVKNCLLSFLTFLTVF